jgi:Tfp pilus assembly protein PilE
MKKNQNGFSAVEILIVVLFVGLISTLGWLIYDRKQNQTETQQEKTSPADETANWKEYRNTEFGFSYKYPTESGWETFLIKADPQMRASGERVNNTGVNYTLCGRNCGLAFAFGIYAKGTSADPGSSFGEKQMNGNTYYKLTSKQSVSKNGVTGTRWEYSSDDSNTAKIIYYYFSKGSLSYAFRVNSSGAITDKTDLTERGEKIMDTFQFTN